MRVIRRSNEWFHKDGKVGFRFRGKYTSYPIK